MTPCIYSSIFLQIRDLNDGGSNQPIDLQGLHIYSITGYFWPYFNRENCDSNGKNCSYTGFVVDFMNEASKAMNFTWSTDIIEDWGMFPKSGYFSLITN